MKTRAERAREWRINNPDKVRAYRAKNKKRRTQQTLEWIRRNAARHRANCKAWADKNRERLQEYQREYQPKWAAKNRKRINERQRKRSHSSQQFARMELYKARRSGKIIRPDVCSRCGKVCRPHGHHADYSKPLEVIWLCKKCHLEIHRFGAL